MTTFCLKLTGALLVLLTVLIGTVYGLPHAASPLLQLIEPPPGCALPCWQGIRPDHTSYHDAIHLLQTDPHFVALDTRQAAADAAQRRTIWYIDWTWNDDSGQVVSGSLVIQSGIVRIVRMNDLLPFGLLWSALGQPDQGSFVGTLGYQGSQPISLPLYHVAIYPESGITLRTDSSCVRFWWQPSMLTVGASTQVGSAYDLGTYRRYACRGWAA
ncbi:MAG: hypothetical protein GC204_02230 [Chloroflexi bacterium]|nr:hypothetical protein [Chloroflexota bacterium]